MSPTIGLAKWAYRAAPAFWERYKEDFQREIRPAPERPAPQTWPDTGLHAAWLGHTTVLLKIDGMTVLTDPVFSRRVGLGLGPVTLGLKRLVYPALVAAELPKIDVVLLSHAHFDHFDVPSLRALESRGTAVVTAARTGDLLRMSRWSKVHELGWGDRVSVGPPPFDDFYRATSRRVLHHVYALTGDLAEAQDCVQEAYARAWQRWTMLVCR